MAIFDEELSYGRDINRAIRIRPNFGKAQVRKVEDIKPGHFYQDVNRVGSHKIMALSTAYKDSDGEWVFDFVEAELHTAGHKREYLNDRGVVSYKSKVWHQTNHMLKLNDRPLTEAELKKLISRIQIWI